MRVKVGLTDRERGIARKKKNKKTLGAIIPGSALAAAVWVFFYFQFQYVSLYLMLGCNISLQIAHVIKF